MSPVLLISYSGAWGGAERILVDLAPALEGDVMLACPEGELAAHAQAAGLRVLLLPQRSLRARGTRREGARAAAALGAHQREIRRLIRDLDPELVVAWGMRSALAALLGRRLGPPVVFQHNDLLPDGRAGTMVRRAAARAALVLALSATIADDLDPGRETLGSRLQVAYPGVDPEPFARLPAAPAEPVVLVLGALVQWKRPDLALEACALARQRLPGLRLRLAGEPFAEDGEELVQRLRARAAEEDLADAVEFLGDVEDPLEALAGAALLLHCSPREPFGLAIVEALAAGRPAVVPDTAGPAEIVDESCGRLYPAGDAAAAAEALVEVLRYPQVRRSLGAAGRRRVRERFALDVSRARWAQAIERVRQDAVADAPAAAGRELAIVTVTHNSAEDLRRLLESVAHHLSRAQVIVVDSGSEDDSLLVAREFGAEAIDLGANGGFGAGCNAGIAAAHRPVTALLNPDVELLDSSLTELAAEALRPEGERRLLAPLVLQADGRRQDSVHPAPTSAADLLRAVVPPAVLPRPLAVPLDPWRARRPRRVGWPVGCALVARTETLRSLGPFDEDTFLYGEDLELGLRARSRGVETWFWPQARVLHRRAHASQREFGGEPFALLARARHQAVERALGRRRAALDDAAQAVTFLSRAVLRTVTRRPSKRERRQLQAVLGRPDREEK